MAETATKKERVAKEGSHPLVAIDDGYAQTKLYGQGPDGKIVKRVLRSSVRIGSHGLGSFAGDGAIGLWQTEEGNRYTVSDEIEAEDPRFTDFHLSPINRVLVNHALSTAGFGGVQVDIVTGLPVKEFFKDQRKDEERIQRKRENLQRGAFSRSAGVEAPVLADIQVGCQAIAAYVDWALDDELKTRNDTGKTIAIVDIGGRTTDVAVVVGGRSIDHGRSGTADVGVLDVYKGVLDRVKARFELDDDSLPLSLMNEAVRTGSMQLFGRPNDVAEIVSDVVGQVQERALREIQRRLGRAATLQAVVFVGGGSALFKDIASAYPNGVMAEDPEFANARGLYKYFASRRRG
ncbi:Plasmid segregation protein ParM [Methylobacterium hispanicum]|uniref:Plasmid segregation protein ParM n=1 Tax=Methylobacterium hispanicum TaxID=270350 RepID=A0AAV4ZJ61_9HYPH|nr:ParM/StbA family protein [Methylobacterium hispanicum]GJD87866.1 Plasmid segregation protein ParM [Methylobacterium hispanicum]